MGPLIEKTFAAVIKDIDAKKGIIEGYFNTWDIIDSDEDELIRGAFTKTIQERGPGSAKPRIMHLWQHDSRFPLYRFTEPGSLKEDETGLFFRSQVSRTTWGRDALQLYEDGVINEHSIGFQVVKQTQESGQHNRITEVKLWEGSAVTWGANANTPVTGVKGLGDKDMAKKFNERIETLTNALKNGGYSDETFILLELQIKQVQAHYNALVEAVKPGPPTDTKDEPDKKVELSLKLF